MTVQTSDYTNNAMNQINLNLEGRAPIALELEDVTKCYGAFRAVDGVSFTLSIGGICGFLGPNGAGKTTTLRMILDILKPTSGRITVLGQPSALEVRRRLGYLPEEKGLYKKMKVWSVIAYFATLKGVPRKQAKQRARDLLDQYGLGEFADKPTEALSKGMGQKVQLLATIAHEPELIILDEPFSGLDPVNQQVMEDMIRDLARRGCTILFSTHVMAHAERLCDRILLLARGRKIFDGTIEQAKRLMPRRVQLETGDAVGALSGLQEVEAVRSILPTNGRPAPNGTARWEVQLRPDAEPQAILQQCFAQGIRLHSFQQCDPSLHDVFMQLVGSETREAA